MKLGLPVGLLGLGLAVGPAVGLVWAGPASAQPYFNCEYSPRCEAIRDKTCEPSRTLKDKVSLIPSHNSAEDLEKTWAVLAAFEPEYCAQLGGRGSILRDFVLFKARIDPRLRAERCATPLACAEAFVGATRERWERDALDAKVKADLEMGSRTAITTAEPAPLETSSLGDVALGRWQTTVKAASPARAGVGR